MFCVRRYSGNTRPIIALCGLSLLLTVGLYKLNYDPLTINKASVSTMDLSASSRNIPSLTSRGVKTSKVGESGNSKKCSGRHCVFTNASVPHVVKKRNIAKRKAVTKKKTVGLVKDPTIKKRFPSVYIIGAGKCGTATLRKFLSAHPSVVFPEVEESWYYDNLYKHGPTFHLSLMPTSRPDQITIENSPGYFHNPTAKGRITRDNPDALYILLLRDPVDRAISHYLHYLRIPYYDINDAADDFEKQAINKNGSVNVNWEPIDFGIYSKYLKEWLKLVPLKRMHIIDGTRFAQNPFPSLKGVENFLGLYHFLDESKFVYEDKKGFYCLRGVDGKPDCMPEGKGRTHPLINVTVYNKLVDFYRPYNEQLYTMVGTRYHWK